MPEHSVTINIAPGKDMILSAGKLAQLANGSCTVRMGDTVVFSAACSGAAKKGQDFFPLQLDYREKYSAAGKFPGGYIKREGRPSDKEILICRMADRPIRPLFPEGFFDEVQVCGLLLAADGKNDGDVLSMLGASCALCLSDLPFQGPIGAVRVGCIDGEFVANPTIQEMEKSTLELVYAGLPDKVIMIEGEAKECSEETLEKAMRFANEIVKKQCEAQIELMKLAGRPKKTPELHLVPEDFKAAMLAALGDKMEAACLVPGKEARLKALDELKTLCIEAMSAEFVEKYGQEDFDFFMQMAFDKIVRATIRKAILEKGYRPDGRGVTQIRPLTAEVGVLPVVHGSALFQRGETQALVIATLGGPKDAQESDLVTGGTKVKKFYLHYNFPNYSTGETGRIAGPGRREIGHGNLAERSVAQVMPKDFPYTVRCVSEIMSSNGSTSMASVCGATLSLMDAGVPIKAPVVGISCGLVTDDKGSELILTDIIGAEDHFGDMDFKICGTHAGITGFQLDLKIHGLPIDIAKEAIFRNREAREKILGLITEAKPAPSATIKPTAPRIRTIMISPDKIGALIGPGGKNIRRICELSGAQIDINEDNSGRVDIFATSEESMQLAISEVNLATAQIEIGKTYKGIVRSIKEFGCFVECLPGQEGLVHVSELADFRVNKVEDVVKLGDEIIVKCVGVDEKGRVRLSRRAAIAEKEGRPYEPKAAEPRGGDRPRRGDRGGSRRSRGDRPHRDVPAGE